MNDRRYAPSMETRVSIARLKRAPAYRAPEQSGNCLRTKKIGRSCFARSLKRRPS
jgi:hypothetical protein